MRAEPYRNAGFTLIEVLIALAVLAIAMIAIMGTASTSTRTATELRDETLADWVAVNELAALRLADTWPQPGTQQGDADMGRRKWHWQATITTTSDPDLLRVDISVSDSTRPDQAIGNLTGFIGRPTPVVPTPDMGGLSGLPHPPKGG